MKKIFAFLIMMAVAVFMTACGANQTTGEDASNAETVSDSAGEKEVAADYLYELLEGEDTLIENLIFEEDVTVSGENAQITFANCEFHGNIINTANVGTRVVLSGSTLSGQCILQNETKEATMETSFPKFIADSSVDVVCEDCVGSVILMGDFESKFNGETYTMADSELFFDIANYEEGFVPYEGQEADYYCVAQWWENGEKIVMIECESDPNM